MGITYACIQAAREYSAVVFNRIPLCPGTFTLAYSRTVATPGPAHTLSRERPTNRAAATARPCTDRQRTHCRRRGRPRRLHGRIRGLRATSTATAPGSLTGRRAAKAGRGASSRTRCWACRRVLAPLHGVCAEVPRRSVLERGCPRPMPILRCRCPPSAPCATSTFAASASTSAEEAEAPTRRPRRRLTGRRRRVAGPGGNASTGAAAAASGRRTTRVRRRRATLALPADWAMQTTMAELASGTAATSLALPRCEQRLFTPLAVNRYCCDRPDDHAADIPTGRAGPGGLEHVIGLG